MTDDDPVADELIDFLRREGANRLAHGRGRNLLDHLVETYAVMRRWKQPAWLAHAALIHSVYGTEEFGPSLISPTRRHELSGIAGEQPERMAYLFCDIPREPLLAGTYRWARLRGDLTREEHDALVLLHLANLAEQACARDGSPAAWLVKAYGLGELLADSGTLEPPGFIAELASFTERDETDTRRAYRAGLNGEESRLAVAAAACPVVAEPCVWLACRARSEGDEEAAASWSQQARKRLHSLGTPWDKRLSFDEWLEVIESDRAIESSGIGAPRVLLDELRRGGPGTPGGRPDRGRFLRYLQTLADTAGGVYPDLPGQPWHEAGQFPLARHLEQHADAIRQEILSLDPATFHRESERIPRRGDWDVAFFYERGRRNDANCAACPVTAHGIDSYPAMRTHAGLIYASRMKPGTHIDPHRGPTNLRVRCHLGISVPEGDCAIRVGDETRDWQEGRCIVFDDFFEHEAWNHTTEDRIVLIVDLWHPGLTAAEISLLEGLHRYAYGHATRLNRYWAANAEAAAG
jgi:aspartate beta-hydroxylase